MSLIVNTHIPRRLRHLILESISENDTSGWIIDDQKHITLASRLWRERAWFYVSHIEPHQSITFGIISRKFEKMTMEEYGVYHGRLTELLMSHFATLFTEIRTSAVPTEHDIVD